MKANRLTISLGIAAVTAGLAINANAQELYGATQTVSYQSNAKVQAKKPMMKIASRDARNLGKVSKPAKSKFHGLYGTHEKVGYDGIVNP